MSSDGVIRCIGSHGNHLSSLLTLFSWLFRHSIGVVRKFVKHNAFNTFSEEIDEFIAIKSGFEDWRWRISTFSIPDKVGFDNNVL